MCRLILAQGSFDAGLVVEAAVSMSIGLTADHDGPIRQHPHGWGAVWRSGTGAGGPLLAHREARPMWESVSRSALSRLSTDLLAIHVRHATLPANQGLHFTHPLHRDGDVGPWYFMHNGFLPTVHQLLGQDRSRFDSAEYFDYVIPPGATALNSDETLSRLNDISPGGSSGNAIAITSERAYVIHWSPSDTPYRRYFTMHKLTGPDFIVIASEIIPSLAATEHWEPLTPQHIVEIPLTASTKGHPS